MTTTIIVGGICLVVGLIAGFIIGTMNEAKKHKGVGLTKMRRALNHTEE